MKSFAERGIIAGKWLARAFELVFAAVFAAALFVCITGTQRNIPWYNMVIVTGLALAGICGVFWALGRLQPFLAANGKWLFPLFCAVWGIALYVFSCAARNEPAHDYSIVYEAALRLARGLEPDWAYFARWGNNTLLLLLLAFLMKAGLLLGMEDPFYLILLFSVLSVIGAGVCIFRLLGRQYGAGRKGGARLQWMGLLLFVGFVPCWGGTFNFYTDSASLCFGIFAVTAAVRAAEAAGRGRDGRADASGTRSEEGVSGPDSGAGIFGASPLGWSLLAGMLWAFGFLLKATSAISMIAYFMAVLWREKRPMRKRRLVCALAGFALLWGGFQAVDNRLPSAALAGEHAAPVEYWLAIGLGGNGSYAQNEELATQILSAPGAALKKTVAREYIGEHLDNLLDMRHLTAKLRYNFASGNFGLADFNRYPVTPFYEFFNDYGKYGGYVTMVTTGYFYAILLILTGGAVRSLLGGFPKEDGGETLYLISRLTIFGLFFFLMLWEANNRQLYNHMPWLAMAGALSLARWRRGA